MKKLYRLALPLTLSIIVTATLLYITSELNTKVITAFLASSAMLILSFFIKGYIDLLFYLVIYGLLSSATVSYMIYADISKGTDPYTYTTLGASLLLIFVVMLSELYYRIKIRRIAEGCLNGEPLNKYVKSPWTFLDEKKKRTICVVYFDIPAFGKLASEINPLTVKRILNYIFAKCTHIAQEHDATVIRRAEDSVLMFLEPSEKTRPGFHAEPDVFCAYSSVICGMKFNQAVDDMKEKVNSSSIKRFKGRVVIATDSGVIIKNIRMGKLEFSLLTDAMHKIDDLTKLVSNDGLIIDDNTYELCSEYFSVKQLSKKAYSVVNMSVY